MERIKKIIGILHTANERWHKSKCQRQHVSMKTIRDSNGRFSLTAVVEHVQ
ncbi:MAG: hypothetical protein LBN19_04830 [Endomicrobium sp.]|jgi:hypothetical protein|nr:hypothetical protein [Endomicrobium sp.]